MYVGFCFKSCLPCSSSQYYTFHKFKNCAFLVIHRVITPFTKRKVLHLNITLFIELFNAPNFVSRNFSQVTYALVRSLFKNCAFLVIHRFIAPFSKTCYLANNCGRAVFTKQSRTIQYAPACENDSFLFFITILHFSQRERFFITILYFSLFIDCALYKQMRL